MSKEYGNKKLAPKDSGTKDSGAKKIDFGTGSAKDTPAPSSAAYKRADSESCYSEFANRNSGASAPAPQSDTARAGGLELNVSAKHNGGQKSDGAPQGM